MKQTKLTNQIKQSAFAALAFTLFILLGTLAHAQQTDAGWYPALQTLCTNVPDTNRAVCQADIYTLASLGSNMQVVQAANGQGIANQYPRLFVASGKEYEIKITDTYTKPDGKQAASINVNGQNF